MTDLAVRVDRLGKQYRIGRGPRGYRTLRESLTTAATVACRTLRGRQRADGREEGPDPATIWALRDVSFEVQRGDVVGIVGRNGAGKSTLLKVLSRITEPTRGCADIYGRIGSLLEVGTGFHPELTGRENVLLSGGILGMSRKEILRQFDRIVAFAAVERFIDTPLKHFSSGMYLRLAFAVAAHLDPDILLVDEVLAVGDVSFQRKCLDRMGQVACEGRTVLFVSHNMGVVRSLCRTGIYLEEGRLEQCGDVGACIARYLDAHQTPDGLAGNGRDGAAEGFGRVTLIGGRDNSIGQAQGFAISTVLRLREENSGFDLHCMLQDMHGRVIFRLRRSSRELGLLAGRGEHCIRLDIPPLWLVPGLYCLELKAKPWGRVQSKYVSDRFPLDVTGEANTTCSADPGFLHPPVAWSMQSKPDLPRRDSQPRHPTARPG